MKSMFPIVVEVANRFREVFNDYVTKNNPVKIKKLCASFTTDVIGTGAFGIKCKSLKDPNFEFRLMGEKVFKVQRHGNSDGKISTGLTVEEVAEKAFAFFLAGFETSSTTAGFGLYELTRQQDVQSKARQEINDVLKKHNQELTYECIKDMHYLNQKLCACIQLYYTYNGEALNDFVVLGYPKFDIEKGTMAFIPAVVFHRDPELYSDLDAFKPERSLQGEVAKRDSVEWLPFGDGPRNCIKKRFGVMQARIGLALLLKNFKFLTCERTQIPIEFYPKSFVLSAKDGIELKVENIL